MICRERVSLAISAVFMSVAMYPGAMLSAPARPNRAVSATDVAQKNPKAIKVVFSPVDVDSLGCPFVAECLGLRGCGKSVGGGASSGQAQTIHAPRRGRRALQPHRLAP